jgi:hypothetical protein
VAAAPAGRRGIVVGDSIAPFPVTCAKAGNRPVSAAGMVQLVTFSTPGDCSTCVPHLRGLADMASAGDGPRDNFIVVYAPGQEIPELTRQYGDVRDVCVDRAGHAWEALPLERTPVTVLLLSGRVALVTDRGLLSDSSKAAFLADVSRLTGQPE